MRVVGAEVGGILAVLFNPFGRMLEDVSLGAGNTHVGGGIRSGLKHERHAEFLAGFLHDRHAAAHGFIAHVAGE